MAVVVVVVVVFVLEGKKREQFEIDKFNCKP